MAADPQADPQGERIRLVIEPGSEEPKIAGGAHQQAAHTPPEDMIDLSRLEDETDYEFEDEGPARPRRRILPLGLAGLALAGFGAIAWYAYQGGMGIIDDETIPLIQADATPIKSRPLTPGGLEVPYRDKLVLNDLKPDPAKPVVERLLPPPEVPKPPIASKQQTAAAPKLEAPRQDNLPEPAPALTVQPAAGKDVTKTAPEPKTEPKTETAPKLAAAPAPKTPATAPQTAAIPGGYLVQLASLKDKNLADAEWVRLRKAYPKLLADKKLVLQKADLGSRGVFHRIRAGYFPDRESAAAICRSLKAKNQACIVAKR